ncbi:MAG: rhomboid family intramembrane serine protease [Moraxella sp.]|nr:rhomboid family intramembrane serine protease [Moraxella sp.]
MSHTTIIVLITVIISILAWQSNAVMSRLIFDPVAITRFKQYDRFLTHGLVHGDAMHLLFNMFTLYSFGRVLESFYLYKLGSLGFVIFYVLAIIVAIIPTFIKHKNNPRYLSLGASGAVSAVLFAYILFDPWNMIYLFAIIPLPAILFAVAYVAYEIYSNKKGNSNINHSAHLYGAAFGILATIALEPAVAIHFFSKLLAPITGQL